MPPAVGVKLFVGPAGFAGDRGQEMNVNVVCFAVDES